MLHSVSRLDIVSDIEPNGMGRGAAAGAVTKHNLENLANRRAVIPA